MADLDNKAWQALRHSRRRLPHPLERSAGNVPAIFGGAAAVSAKARSERIWTGCSLTGARQKLVESGLDAAAADLALGAAAVRHFRGFAGSWGSYIQRNGWLYELLDLDEDERRRIVERCHIKELAGLVARLLDNPASIMLDVTSLAELTRLANQIQQDKEHPDSPIRHLLTARHGLDPELALAVLKYSQSVPWWALLAFPVGAVVCALVFLAAIVNPHADFFENAGGVGIAHYTLVPLLAIGFGFASVWLVKTRPQRERAWREQLAKYEQNRLEQVS
jgi:hypothetical protein